MDVRPFGDSDLKVVANWLDQKGNYEWLDFGNGVQRLSPVLLKVMVQRQSNVLYVYTSEAGDEPIGVVALNNVSSRFRTAMLWYVLGDKQFAGRGFTTRAASRLLTIGFKDLALASVNAWTVEMNLPSIRVLERNNFRLIGRQRRCHVLDGKTFDRFLFDLLASEHREAA